MRVLLKIIIYKIYLIYMKLGSRKKEYKFSNIQHITQYSLATVRPTSFWIPSKVYIYSN